MGQDMGTKAGISLKSLAAKKRVMFLTLKAFDDAVKAESLGRCSPNLAECVFSTSVRHETRRDDASAAVSSRGSGGGARRVRGRGRGSSPGERATTPDAARRSVERGGRRNEEGTRQCFGPEMSMGTLEGVGGVGSVTEAAAAGVVANGAGGRDGVDGTQVVREAAGRAAADSERLEMMSFISAPTTAAVASRLSARCLQTVTVHHAAAAVGSPDLSQAQLPPDATLPDGTSLKQKNVYASVFPSQGMKRGIAGEIRLPTSTACIGHSGPEKLPSPPSPSSAFLQHVESIPSYTLGGAVGAEFGGTGNRRVGLLEDVSVVAHNSYETARELAAITQSPANYDCRGTSRTPLNPGGPPPGASWQRDAGSTSSCTVRGKATNAYAASGDHVGLLSHAGATTRASPTRGSDLDPPHPSPLSNPAQSWFVAGGSTVGGKLRGHGHDSGVSSLQPVLAPRASGTLLVPHEEYPERAAPVGGNWRVATKRSLPVLQHSAPDLGAVKSTRTSLQRKGRGCGGDENARWTTIIDINGLQHGVSSGFVAFDGHTVSHHQRATLSDGSFNHAPGGAMPEEKASGGLKERPRVERVHRQQN